MTSLTETQAVLDTFEHLTTLEAELNESLIQLKVIQHDTVDVPQFGRGEPLPDTIDVKPRKQGLAESIKLCTSPQYTHQYEHNLPKRIAGILQLQATSDEYDEIEKLTIKVNKTRTDIISKLVQLEPNSRKRAKLSRTMFPDVLYQTLSRKIPLLPYNPKTVLFSWCTKQKSIKKLSVELAEAIITNINAGCHPFQAQRNLNRLREVDTVYKVTEVRVHPQVVIKYYDCDSGKVKYETRKAHSPVIALTKSDQPIRYDRLTSFEHKDQEHNTLKAYKPLIEGTCLVYKNS